MDSQLYPSSRNGLKINRGGRLNLSAVVVKDANTAGGVLKAGDSTNPVTNDAANMQFISGYFDSGAADASNSDSRAASFTLKATGLLQDFSTGVYGEVTVAAGGNVRNPVGVQGQLTFDANSFIQGLGYAVGGYLSAPAKACNTGTMAVGNFEYNFPASYSQGASPVASVIRAGVGGDSTAVASFEDNGFLFEFFGLSAGSGKIFNTQGAGAYPAALVASLKIRVGTTEYWIPLQNQQAA